MSRIPTIKFSSSQEKALKKMRDGGNLFLTGKGGTGKSFLVEAFVATKENPVVLAPTGPAAINVKGSTIHSFFGLVPHYRDPMSYYEKFAKEIAKPEGLWDEKVKKIFDLVVAIDCLVVDEVGMVRSDVFSAMDLICRACMEEPNIPFGGIQVIGVGDLYQLPPVVTNQEKRWIPNGKEWFFISPGFNLDSFEIIELTEVQRQSEKEWEFVDCLNAIRENELEDWHLEFINKKVTSEVDKDSVVLCSRKKRASDINQEKLENLSSKFIVFDGDYFGDDEQIQNFPVSKKLWMKKDAKVMFLTNNPAKGWFNGMIGTFIGKRGDAALVRVGEKLIHVPKHEFEIKKYVKNSEGQIDLETVASLEQLPLQLSWAITIHKAQGKSLDKIHLDLGEQGAFAHGQSYVGLSRCISYEGLTLEHPLNEKDVKCDPVIKEFMSKAILA